jgi:hypothetical protein
VSHSFLPAAEAEYLEAVRFFEEQRAGLGSALIAEFERIVGLAAEKPDSWKLVHQSGVRRIGLKRFPYAVFYRSLAQQAASSHRVCPSSPPSGLLA